MEGNLSWLHLKWQLKYVSSELQREALRKTAETAETEVENVRPDNEVRNLILGHQIWQSFLTKLSVDWIGQYQRLRVWPSVKSNWTCAVCISYAEQLPHSIIRNQIRPWYLNYSVSTFRQESLSIKSPVQTFHARVILPLCKNKQKLKALVGERNCINMN